MNTYYIPKGNRNYKEYSEYCTGLPFVFTGANTLEIDYSNEAITVDGTITGFEAITKPVPPVLPVTISKIEFMNRFTTTELATILTVAKTNVGIEVFVKKLDLADTVTINGTDAIAGVTALEAGGLLSAGRGVEILTI